MNSVKKLYISTIFLTFFLIFTLPTSGTTSESNATTRYVSDFLIINLRDNMEPPYSVVSRIKTGEPLRVLREKGNYYQVETSEKKIGWVSKQFTTSDTPKSIIIKTLEEKISQLESKDENGLKDLINQKDRAVADLQKAEDNIAFLNNKVTQLQKLSSTLRTIDPEKYNSALTALKELQDSHSEQETLLISTQKANRTFQLKSNIYWFLAGAFVLFFGILLGKIPGKKQKKFTF